MHVHDVLNWVTEVQPIIKQSSSVEEGLIKFAEDKNLAPAQLEKLAHIINAGATTTFLEKNADTNTRGNDFTILDVPELVSTYTKAAKKKCKGPKEMKRYQKKQSWFDLTPESDIQEYSLVEVEKAASAKAQVETLNSRELRKAARQLDDLNDQLHSARERCKEAFVAFFKDETKLASYKDFESDTLFTFGKDAQEALDYLHGLLPKAQQLQTVRTKDAGYRRLIKNANFVSLVGDYMDVENEIKEVAELTEKCAHVLPNPVLPSTENENSSSSMFVNLDTTARPRSKPLASHPDEIYDDSASGLAESLFSTTDRKDLPGMGAIQKAIGGLPRMAKDQYDSVINKRNQGIVDATDAARYQSILTELMLTDDLIAEEDEMDVADKYTSLINLSPELAKDINFAKVYLRGAVQHDGMDVFTANQLADAELASRKRTFDGGGDKSNKPQRVDININDRTKKD